MNKVLSAIRTTLEKQTKALNSPEYRITLQNEKKAFLFRNKPLSPDELTEEKRLYILNTKNLVEKLNIYITPLSLKHDFYLIDDVTEEALQQIKAKYNICCLLQTSFQNFQVILKTEQLDIPTKIKSKYQNKLNHAHGDPDILGHPHAFRCVGFKNVKPQYLDSKTGYFPIVNIIFSRDATCNKATAEILSLSKSESISEPANYNLQAEALSTSELLKTAQLKFDSLSKIQVHRFKTVRIQQINKLEYYKNQVDYYQKLMTEEKAESKDSIQKSEEMNRQFIHEYSEKYYGFAVLIMILVFISNFLIFYLKDLNTNNIINKNNAIIHEYNICNSSPCTNQVEDILKSDLSKTEKIYALFKANYSQHQIAEYLNISQSTVSRSLNGII